jgi:hypothetical protein
MVHLSTVWPTALLFASCTLFQEVLKGRTYVDSKSSSPVPQLFPFPFPSASPTREGYECPNAPSSAPPNPIMRRSSRVPACTSNPSVDLSHKYYWRGSITLYVIDQRTIPHPHCCTTLEKGFWVRLFYWPGM